MEGIAKEKGCAARNSPPKWIHSFVIFRRRAHPRQGGHLVENGFSLSRSSSYLPSSPLPLPPFLCVCVFVSPCQAVTIRRAPLFPCVPAPTPSPFSPSLALSLLSTFCAPPHSQAPHMPEAGILRASSSSLVGTRVAPSAQTICVANPSGCCTLPRLFSPAHRFFPPRVDFLLLPVLPKALPAKCRVCAEDAALQQQGRSKTSW